MKKKRKYVKSGKYRKRSKILRRMGAEPYLSAPKPAEPKPEVERLNKLVSVLQVERDTLMQQWEAEASAHFEESVELKDLRLRADRQQRLLVILLRDITAGDLDITK